MVYCWLVHLTFNEGKKEEVSPSTPAALQPQIDTQHRAQHPAQHLSVYHTIQLINLALRPVWCHQWLSLWTAVAAHVKALEPNCLSYELFHDEKDPDSVFILERYVSEHDLTITHRQSAPFLALRARNAEAQLVKTGVTKGYHESEIGFVCRGEVAQK